MGPSPDPNVRHVSSEAIEGIARHLKSYALAGPAGVEQLLTGLKQIEVSALTFGVVGAPIYIGFQKFREEAQRSLEDVRKTVDNYVTELGRARDAWVEAENRSTVVVEE